MANETILFRIAARRPNSDSTEDMVIHVDNVPSGSTFSMGTQEGERWVFTPQDFGEVELSLPPDTSGNVALQVTAFADGATRRRTLVITVQSNETDFTTEEMPTLEVTDSGTRTPTDSETLAPTDSETLIPTDSETLTPTDFGTPEPADSTPQPTESKTELPTEYSTSGTDEGKSGSMACNRHYY